MKLVNHHLSRLVDISGDGLDQRDVGVLLLEPVGEGLQLERLVVELRAHVGLHQLWNLENVHELGVVVERVLGGGPLRRDLHRRLTELLAGLAQAGQGRL